MRFGGSSESRLNQSNAGQRENTTSGDVELALRLRELFWGVTSAGYEHIGFGGSCMLVEMWTRVILD